MIESGASLLTSAAQVVVNKVEQYDPESKKRDVVYGEQKTENKVTEASNDQVILPEDSNVKKLNVVIGSLLDLWIYEGYKSLEYIKQSKAYQLTDSYINYVEKFELVKQQSLKLGASAQKTVAELSQRCVLFYDEASKFVGMLIKVAGQNQEKLLKYVKDTYDNVSTFAHENYIRLDFNGDGKIDLEDVRKSLQSLYKFLCEFDYIQATQQISNTVYNEARKLVSREAVQSDDIPIVEEDPKQKEKSE